MIYIMTVRYFIWKYGHNNTVNKVSDSGDYSPVVIIASICFI